MEAAMADKKVTGLLIDEEKLAAVMRAGGVTAQQDLEGVTFATEVGEVRINTRDVEAATQDAGAASALLLGLGVPEDVALRLVNAGRLFGLLETVERVAVPVDGADGPDDVPPLELDDSGE